MQQLHENKEFILRYFNALSGIKKTRESIAVYVTDQQLIEHILFFDSVFPAYEVFADEMTAEGDRVVVFARMKGRHAGELNGIAPTFREVDLPFAIGYEIQDDKIVHHWLIADQMALMEQLGVLQSMPA